MLAAATNGGTATLGTPFFGLDDLISLYYGLSAPNRAGASWIMANGSISKVAQLKDGGTTGQYLWNPSPAIGQPDTLLGRGVYEDPYLAAPGSATKSVLVGDIASSCVIKCSPIRAAISTDFLFNTDQVAVKTVWRIGIGVVLADGIRYLVSSNT